MAALNGGRGIGLAAVRGEAVSHAGPTSAESGTRRATVRPRRVLLVEDEDMVRKVVTRMLTARGFEVQAAASGTEAMALFDAADLDTFDLLVTDLMMPDGGGLGVARTLTAKLPKLKVLLVSGYSPTGTDGWEPERFRFLNKPFGSAELARAIDELFASTPAS